MLMVRVCGAPICPFALRMNPIRLHQPVNSAPGAAKLRMEHVMQAIQPKRRVLFVQGHQYPQKFLVAQCSGTGFLFQPCVISAAGDFQYPA